MITIDPNGFLCRHGNGKFGHLKAPNARSESTARFSACAPVFAAATPKHGARLFVRYRQSRAKMGLSKKRPFFDMDFLGCWV